MRRRDLVCGLAAAAALPIAGRAQQALPPTIGFLHYGTAAAMGAQLAAFHKGLAEAGYQEGKNLLVEYRWGEGDYARLPEMTNDLVRRAVAIIVAPNLNSAVAARQATVAIPIVFLIGDDPVKHGLVASLNRPGGNATGISMLAAGLVSKRLEFLRELVPNAEAVGLLVNPNNPNAATQRLEMQEAARTLRQTTHVFEARNDVELEATFTDLSARHTGGLVVGPDPFFNSRHRQIVALAARHAIPAIYEWREFVEAGGLASYGSDLRDSFRQVGAYTGKVLAGAKPADLPVQQPTEFELVINLKTAQALGLTVPPTLLARADEIIE